MFSTVHVWKSACGNHNRQPAEQHKTDIEVNGYKTHRRLTEHKQTFIKGNTTYRNNRTVIWKFATVYGVFNGRKSF